MYNDEFSSSPFLHRRILARAWTHPLVTSGYEDGARKLRRCQSRLLLNLWLRSLINLWMEESNIENYIAVIIIFICMKKVVSVLEMIEYCDISLCIL